MPLPENDLHVNRARAASKIGPLFSWQRLRELPWPFRAVMILLAVVVALAMLAAALLPLWMLLSALFA